MGLDFLSRVAKPFRKRWDGQRDRLSVPDLFTFKPEMQPQTFLFAICEDRELHPGEELVIRMANGGSSHQIQAFCGETLIAISVNAPVDVFGVQAGTCALGTVMAVRPISRTADIAVM